MTGLLAIHTATDLCEIAFVAGDGDGDGDGVRTLRADGPRSHSEQLVPLVLEITGGDVSAIQGIALAAGPGSFTGLRIGLSTAKGIAFGRGVPVYAVSTLAALAKAADGAGHDAIVPVMRARQGELYAGMYRAKENSVRPVTDDTVVRDDELGTWIRHHVQTESGIVIAGPDAVYITRNTGLEMAAADIAHSAGSVLELSAELPDEYLVEELSSFEPYYCKEFVARQPRQSIFDRLPF